MCGIVGIYNHKEASTLAYLSLYALQHRGQEGVGIAAFDGERIRAIRGAGLVAEVFEDQRKLLQLPGDIALGHVRYSTHGDSRMENIQPLIFNYKNEQIAICHNGNLVNWESHKTKLEKSGALFQTTSDSEYIIHLMARSKGETIEEKLMHALS